MSSSSGDSTNKEENDLEFEVPSLDLNSQMSFSLIPRGPKSEPGIFVSGWDQDDDGVEETENDMDTNDTQKMILKSAEFGNLESVAQLLNDDPSLVHVRDSDLYTPLHRAAYNDHTDVIRVLLQKGADSGALTENSWTPLHCAACWGCFDAATVLILEAKVNINAETNGGITPLHLAAACTEDPVGAAKIAELLLLQPGIVTEVKNAGGETALEIARRTSGPIYALIKEYKQGKLTD